MSVIHDTRGRFAPGAEHGTLNMYQKHGCRCDPCSDAKRAYFAEWKSRHKPALPPKPGNLSVGPLERLVLSRHHNVPQYLGISNETWDGWRLEGIPPVTADHYCCKLGHHPSELWGPEELWGAEWFAVSTEGEPQ